MHGRCDRLGAQTIFDSLDAPTLYSLGDNKWTDCHRTNNGSYDPIERLAFLLARQRHLAGIVIGIQADVFFPVELSDGGYQETFLPTLTADNGYTGFVNTLVEETLNFDGQVLLVHGDSHYFKMDKAMTDQNGRSTPNFTRIEVFGSSDNSWVEMTVDPNSDSVFTFAPVVLK